MTSPGAAAAGAAAAGGEAEGGIALGRVCQQPSNSSLRCDVKKKSGRAAAESRAAAATLPQRRRKIRTVLALCATFSGVALHTEEPITHGRHEWGREKSVIANDGTTFQGFIWRFLPESLSSADTPRGFPFPRFASAVGGAWRDGVQRRGQIGKCSRAFGTRAQGDSESSGCRTSPAAAEADPGDTSLLAPEQETARTPLAAARSARSIDAVESVRPDPVRLAD